MFNKFKFLIEKFNNYIESRTFNEKILLSIIIFLILPIFYNYTLYDWQKKYYKKIKNEFSSLKLTYDKLVNEQRKCENMQKEINENEFILKQFKKNFLETNDVVKLLNVINELIMKYNLNIDFFKKGPQFERMYEKNYVSNENDAFFVQFNYKILPIEFSFKSDFINFLIFLKIIENFKNLNFNLKYVEALRTNDGNIEVNIVIEIITECNFKKNI